jgi:hypothetical protein
MRRVVLCMFCAWLPCQPAAAQDLEISVNALTTFYADNTEFSNPFREGETLIGAFGTIVVEARPSDRLALRAGVFGHQRFGSEHSFDEARPVLTLVIGGPRSRLVLGTLETMRRIDGAGPDRTSPHGLLPPLQRETLAFDRPWEAGVQWTVDTTRVKHEAWLHWQRRETRSQRERFDIGATSRIRLREALTLRGDVHVVHQGGQLSAVGPVADSTAAGVGVDAGGRVGPIDRVSLEGLAFVSRYVPDRGRAPAARTGFGTFVRAAAEEGTWRLHALASRSDDFIKQEGDRHYQSLRRDGTEHRSVRDYAEAGVTRMFALAPGSWIEASARWHRVENDYEYSFRVLAVGRITAWLRR